MSNNKLDPLNAELIETAKQGDIKLMRQLMQDGAYPFTMDAHGKTAISYVFEKMPDGLGKLIRDLNQFTYKGRNRGDDE